MTFGRIIQQIGYLLFSYASSVSIIFINKYIYNDKKVAGTLLMAFHFITCFIVSYILHVLNNLFKNPLKETTTNEKHQTSKQDELSILPTTISKQDNDSTETEIFSVFECKFMSISDGILFSLSVSSALLFGNLSLIHNSISVYQLSKLMVIPCLIAINYFYFNMKMEKKIVGSLILIVLGMMLVIGFDIMLNWFGTLICLFAIVTGATSQISINYFCKKYKMNGFELLLNHSLFSSVLMAIAAVPVDGLESITYSVNLFNGNSSFFLAVLASGFAAFFVNVSGYLVIGKLSPLTFQVLGHAKTVSVLIGGFFLFGNEKDLSIHTLIGLSIALIGTFFYSFFKFNEETVSNAIPSTREQILEKPISILNGNGTLEHDYIKNNVSSVSSFGNQPIDDYGNNSKLNSPRSVLENDEEDETSQHSNYSSAGADEGRLDEFKRTNSPLETV